MLAALRVGCMSGKFTTCRLSVREDLRGGGPFQIALNFEGVFLIFISFSAWVAVCQERHRGEKKHTLQD